MCGQALLWVRGCYRSLRCPPPRRRHAAAHHAFEEEPGRSQRFLVPLCPTRRCAPSHRAYRQASSPRLLSRPTRHQTFMPRALSAPLRRRPRTSPSFRRRRARCHSCLLERKERTLGRVMACARASPRCVPLTPPAHSLPVGRTRHARNKHMQALSVTYLSADVQSRAAVPVIRVFPPP